jgi:hypothetical protein
MKKGTHLFYAALIFLVSWSSHATLIEVKFSMSWSSPAGAGELFGIDTASFLDFSVFVDTDDAIKIVEAGSSNGSYTYTHDLYSFSVGNISLSEVLFGNKLWEVDDLSNIGFSTNGTTKEGTFVIEGGVKADQFVSAAIRFVDEEGRLDFNTCLSSTLNDDLCKAGVMQNIDRTAAVWLQGQQLSLQKVPEPNLIWLLGCTLMGLILKNQRNSLS